MPNIFFSPKEPTWSLLRVFFFSLTSLFLAVSVADAWGFSLYSIFWLAFLPPIVPSIKIFFFFFWRKLGINYLMLCLSSFFFSSLLFLIYFPFYFLDISLNFSFPLSLCLDWMVQQMAHRLKSGIKQEDKGWVGKSAGEGGGRKGLI